MRTPTTARAAAAAAVALVLVAGAAGSAAAAKGGKGGGKPSKPSTTTSLTGPSAIRAAHEATCPLVAEYTVCGALSVTIADFGNTGWAAQAGPAKGTVTYNSYYSSATQADWSAVVAHEVGGHVDVWNEIVATVGVGQAWTDYYDLDHFAAPWATAAWSAVTAASRPFGTAEAKEAFLDCAGPVAHGYRGNYLYLWGLTSTSAQRQFCAGSDAVLTSALTSSR